MKYLFYLILLFAVLSCQKVAPRSDAYGNFEAREILVSPEVPGKIISLGVEEGQVLDKDAEVGLVDTSLLYLQKKTILASIRSIEATRQSVGPQLAVLEAEKKHLLHERERIKKLLAGNAATRKQLDEVEAQLAILEQKKRATKAKFRDLNHNIALKSEPLKAQLQQVEAKIAKSIVRNPIRGTVLEVYKYEGEIASPGFPLYKIADLRTMELRAYITGAQLTHVKPGQEVDVLIDESKEKNKALRGKVSWISGKAEFTPKTIQTKEERVALVYAIKVIVPNDGSIKIGMPGEINFTEDE